MSQSLLKSKIQAGVQGRVNDFWKEKIGQYIMQGDYLGLIMEEGSCVTWRSYLWDVPRGILKFALNAGLNTLPSLDNLKRWGKRVSDRCSFCGNSQTLLHVLSNCQVALHKYAPLVADISRVYKTYLFSIEISVRGQVSGDNKKRLKAFVYRSCVDPKPIFKSLVQICSKIALLSSYSIFTARNEPTWESPSLLINY